MWKFCSGSDYNVIEKENKVFNQNSIMKEGLKHDPKSMVRNSILK